MMTNKTPSPSSIQDRHLLRIRAEFGSLDRWTNMSAFSDHSGATARSGYEIIVALVFGPISSFLAAR